jgi:hypothetical protein
MKNKNITQRRKGATFENQILFFAALRGNNPVSLFYRF